MRIRVIDLDGSIPAQDRLLRTFRPDVYDLRRWGPKIRLACRWERFYRFERQLDRFLGSADSEPMVSFVGSGDFHHVTLAFLRRLRQPCNLLVLDKHPDWMRGMPFLHCGTWLHHAARLPNVRRVFHLGGHTDFDNGFRWLAPTQLIHSGKIVTIPAVRSFGKGFWRHLPQKPLRAHVEAPVTYERLEELLWAHLDDLDRVPLYVSLDKDVLWMPESIANWDSGYLDLTDVQEILQFFLKAAGNDLIGMDITGDWSPVVTSGIFRQLLHRFEHPHCSADADQARLCNERTNLQLMRFLHHDAIEQRVRVGSRLNRV